MRRKFLFIIFALAIVFAGVFYVNTKAYAETERRPWNAAIEVSYNGDVFRYELSEHIADCEAEANERGFYLGSIARHRLFDELVARQLPLSAIYEYLFPNFFEMISHFSYVCKQRTDATVSFDSKGFRYAEGQDGVSVDEERLAEALLESDGKTIKMQLPLNYDKAVTVAELKRNTVLKGTFTTYYKSSGANRRYNIARSASSISGLTLCAGETFSFNNVVGPRTVENGYKQAKVIMDGLYADGVGGGVCQVSTTLYNALLLANFIPAASQHSLVSSYVKAGFDAMVSYGVADLTFVNNTEHNVYVQAVIGKDSVTFNVYGEPNKYRVERESVEQREPFKTIEVVDKAKYPELTYTDEFKVVTSGSDGVKTSSYLKYYLDGVLTDTKLIRRNNYKRVDCVIARGDLPRPEEETQ